MNIAAVIINWNTLAHLRNCLDSFLREGVSPENLVVVDQGSSDGSPDMVSQTYPAVKLVVMAKNAGYAQACNHGIEKTNCPVVVIANADTVVGDGCITRLFEFMDSHPDVALAGPTMLDVTGRRVTRFSRTSVLRGLLLEVFPKGLRGVWRDAERSAREQPDPFPVTYVEGAFMAVRRKAYADLGGMDEGFSFFFEDADLPTRVLKAGYRVMHVPSALVTHIGGASFSQVPASHATEFHRNMVRLYRRHAPRKAVWLERWLRVILSVKLAALKLFDRIGFRAPGRIERNRVVRSSLSSRSFLKRPPEESPLVSIIIPTYDRPEVLLNLINRLKDQTYSKTELIVIDQSDPPVLLDEEALTTSVQQVHLNLRNRSVAKNRGIAAARGDLLLFCDDDIEPEPNLVETHVHSHQEQGVGGVSCRVIEEGLPEIQSTDICRVTWYGKMIDRFQSDVACPVETLVGANMSVKRSVLHEVGYFDAVFRGTSIFEEQDFSERLRSLGMKIHFTNKSTVKHLRQPGGNVGIRSKEPASYYCDFHHNELVFFLKNRNHWLLVFVIPFCFLRSIRQSMRHQLSFKGATHMFSGVFAGISSYYSSLK